MINYFNLILEVIFMEFFPSMKTARMIFNILDKYCIYIYLIFKTEYSCLLVLKTVCPDRLKYLFIPFLRFLGDIK